MIDALHLPLDKVARAYSRRSRIYARTVARWERPHHETALTMAAVQPGERVLDVAVGPGGRMVLLNMSKPDAATRTFREWMYRHLPTSVVLYLMGACRPVLVAGLATAAGFTDVERGYLAGGMPSEVVVAHR